MPELKDPKQFIENTALIIDQMRRQDYWKNESTGIGTDYDRQARTRQANRARPSDKELEAFYIDNDIASTVVDRVAEEAIRQGYSLSYEGVAPGEAEDIVKWAESKYQVASHLLQGRKWSRLFGGAGVMIGADNGKDLIEPLEEGYEISFLRPFSRLDMETTLWYNEDEDVLTQKFGIPAIYRVIMKSGGAGVHLAQAHETRFHILQGILTTKDRFIDNNGWGDSVLTRVLDTLRRFDSSWISVMSLLTDSSIPIYKIKDFMAHLESDQLDALIARLSMIDQQKNNLRPIIMDADSESYERVAAELTDVGTVLQNTMIRMSAASKLPVSILFGQAPAGLNASPEGDLRNFYDKVDVERKENFRPALLHIYRMLLAQKSSPLKGKVPECLTIEFPSLWQTDPVQAATLYQMISTADGVYMANHVVDPAEVAIARAANAQTFGFPAIDVGPRKEFLKLMRNPEGIVTGAGELPGSINLPSNALIPRNELGRGQGEETGAPTSLSVESEPQKAALSGAQIKSLESLVEKVAQGALPKSAAVAIVMASFPIEQAAAEAIFADLDDLYAESSAEERAELRALPFGGINPGNDGKVEEGEEVPEEGEEEQEPPVPPEPDPRADFGTALSALLDGKDIEISYT